MPDPTSVKLANSWIILNSGGGPTPDKSTVLLETPPNPDRASRFLNPQVADVCDCYACWKAKGPSF
jgi:hypothetical protein